MEMKATNESAIVSHLNGEFKSKDYLSLSSLKEEHLSEDIIRKYKAQCKGLIHLRISKETSGSIFTQNNKVVCYYNTEKKDDEVWFQALEILPDYQGHGLSYQLLSRAIKHDNATKLSVNKKNEIAIKIYVKAGFKSYKETDSMIFMEPNNTKQTRRNITMEMTNESIIKLANYFGEDPTIACESAGTFMEKAKEKIKSIGIRIKEFIDKAITWIKVTFSNFMKHKDYKVDGELWLIVNKIIKELTEFEKKNIRRMNEKDLSTDKDKIQEMSDNLERQYSALRDSREYIAMASYDPKAKDNIKYIKVDTSTLQASKESISQQLKLLEADYDLYRSKSESYDDSYAILGTIMSTSTLVLSDHISFINTLIRYSKKL